MYASSGVVAYNYTWHVFGANSPFHVSLHTTTRLSSSETAYEAYHAAVGLLALWHQQVIDEDTLPVKRPTASKLLDALEQVKRIIIK